MPQLALTAALLLPLGLDTLALATALGLAGLAPGDRLRVALVFTLFEAAMPVAGILVGQALDSLIGRWAGYAGIAALAAAGVLLLRGGDEAAEARQLGLLARARGPAILSLGLSISLDELTVGLSAGLLGLPLGVAVAWIAVQTFVVAQVGLRLGGRLGDRVRERAERLAGIAFIALAALLLVLKLLAL